MGCGASAAGWRQDTLRDSERSEGVSQSMLAEAVGVKATLESWMLALARYLLIASHNSCNAAVVWRELRTTARSASHAERNAAG